MSRWDIDAHAIGPGPQCWHHVAPGSPWPPVLRRTPREDSGYHLDSDGPCPPPAATGRPPAAPPPTDADFPF